MAVSTFGLSFHRPEGFLLLVAAIPLIIAFLVEPLRRRHHEPFFFLWRALIQPRPWLGRLGRWVELLALLALLFLVVAAVADPGEWRVRSVPSARVVAVVDPGLAGGDSLRREANERACDWLRSREPGEVACVVVARSDGAEITLTTAADFTPGWVLAGSPETAPTGPADRTALARLVARIVRQRSTAQVLWIDAKPPDGLPPDWQIQPLAGALEPRVVSMRANRMAGGELSVDVRNAGRTAWTGALRLRSEQDTRTIRALVLPPGQGLVTTLIWPVGVNGVVHLDLVAEGADHPDDTIGHYVPSPHRPGLGIFAGTTTAWIWRAVLEHGFGDRIDPARSGVLDARKGLAFLEQHRSGPPPFDLLIFEQPPDPWPSPRVPVLLFGGPGPLGTIGPEPGKDGGFASWERDHPLLCGVDLSPVTAEKVVSVQPAENVQVLARGPAGPMLLLRPGPPAVAAFSFRFQDSNLFAYWSFTSLISNLLQLWGGEPEACGPLQTGEAFPVPAGDEPVRVERHGDTEPLWVGRADEGFAFRPRRTGWFTARGNHQRRDAFVNPRPVVAPAAEEPAVLALPDSLKQRPTPLPDERWWSSMAWILAGIGLVLSLFEWALFHRGVS